MEYKFFLKVEESEQSLLLKLKGDLLSVNSSLFDEELKKLIMDFRNIVIDLSEIDILDSSIISRLIRFRNLLASQGRQVSLMPKVSRSIKTILEVIQLDVLFNVRFEDRGF